MYMLTYQILWKKMIDIFELNIVPVYDHQGLTEVVHKWVQTK
jgi:hypothetical protein